MSIVRILETAVMEDFANRDRFLVAYASILDDIGCTTRDRFKFKIEHHDIVHTGYGREVIDLISIDETKELLQGWSWRVVADNSFMSHQGHREHLLLEFTYELEKYASMIYDDNSIVKNIKALTNI